MNYLEKNKFLIALLKNHDLPVLVDTNFFIAPDKFSEVDFEKFWITPIIDLFTGLMIHESVEKEMVGTRLKAYAKRLKVCYNSELDEIDKIAYDLAYETIEDELDVGIKTKNKNRGEAETLAYIFAKGYTSVISRDKDIIENINSGRIGVLFNGECGVIHFYELLYILHKKNIPSKIIKALFKRFYTNGISYKDKTYKSFTEISNILDGFYSSLIEEI